MSDSLSQRQDSFHQTQKNMLDTHYYHFSSVYIILYSFHIINKPFPGGMCERLSAHQVLKWQKQNV